MAKNINSARLKSLDFIKRHNMDCESFDIEAAIKKYADEMDKGLSDSSSFAMVPTYIEMGKKVPLNKKVIVIDAGGTSLRIATVYFDDDEKEVVENFSKYKMPGTYGEITADEFYKTLAKYLEPVEDLSDTIAFCFSFTTKVQPNKDAVVTLLGKQIQIKGLLGTCIGESLNKELKSPKKVVILNDSVATLLGGAGRAISKNLYDYYIGFILGTGSNTCYLEENRNIKKIDHDEGSMVVNMESGGYTGFPRSDIDIEFDKTTRDPGVFPFEKIIGGKYEGGLFLTLLRTAAKEDLFSKEFCEKLQNLTELPSFHVDKFVDSPLESGVLSDLCCDDSDREVLYNLVDLFYDRSALLILLNFAAVITRSGKGKNPIRPACVVIEGSTILNSTMLRGKLEYFIKSILNEKLGLYLKLLRCENTNMIGTATAGLTN